MMEQSVLLGIKHVARTKAFSSSSVKWWSDYNLKTSFLFCQEKPYIPQKSSDVLKQFIQIPLLLHGLQCDTKRTGHQAPRPFTFLWSEATSCLKPVYIQETGRPTEIAQYAAHKSLFQSSQCYTTHQYQHIRKNVSHGQHRILTLTYLDNLKSLIFIHLAPHVCSYPFTGCIVLMNKFTNIFSQRLIC